MAVGFSPKFASQQAEALRQMQQHQVDSMRMAFGGGLGGGFNRPFPRFAEDMTPKEKLRAQVMKEFTEMELLEMIKAMQQPAQNRIRKKQLKEKKYTEQDIQRVQLRVVA